MTVVNFVKPGEAGLWVDKTTSIHASIQVNKMLLLVAAAAAAAAANNSSITAK